jgi:hypothetical protein
MVIINEPDGIVKKTFRFFFHFLVIQMTDRFRPTNTMHRSAFQTTTINEGASGKEDGKKQEINPRPIILDPTSQDDILLQMGGLLLLLLFGIHSNLRLFEKQIRSSEAITESNQSSVRE